MEAIIQTHRRNSLWIERLVSHKLFWVIMVTFLFVYPIARSLNRTLPNELPVITTLPEFSFTNESGKPFGSSDLRGKVYLANFIFTNCQTVCPDLLGKIQKVQHRLRGVVDRVAIVSFTVDPLTDTPSVLYQKARELKANPNVWRFLSAGVEETRQLLVDGFKVPMGNKEMANSVMDVAHSSKLVLVDQQGRVRGYYSTEKQDIDKLMIDVGLMINRNKVPN